MLWMVDDLAGNQFSVHPRSSWPEAAVRNLLCFPFTWQLAVVVVGLTEKDGCVDEASEMSGDGTWMEVVRLSAILLMGSCVRVASGETPR